MSSRARSKLNEQRGAVAVTVAIGLTVFIGFLALVVDVGYMYEMRRQLQSAADAAALAGMTEKLTGATADVVMDVVEDYASRNDNIDPSADLEVLTVAPHSVLDEDDWIRVGVRKNANLFFARIFGRTDQMIYAQAQARRVYVHGIGDAVPWGLGVVDAVDMNADLDNGTPQSLEDPDGDDEWEGDLPVPAASGPNGHLVDVAITNSQSYVTTLEDIARITVDAPDDGVSDVYLSADNAGPGDPVSLYVEVDGTIKGAPSIKNSPFSSAAFTKVGSGLYRATLTAPAVAGPLVGLGIDVEIGAGSSKRAFNNAAVLTVVNGFSPVESIELSDRHWQSAGGGFLGITVRMRTFEYGKTFVLKLRDGENAEAGNFNALDYSNIVRDGELLDQTGGHDYKNNLTFGFPDEILIGDEIATKPGAISSTRNALIERFGDCAYAFEAWEDAGQPPDCGRLASVPLVEIFEDITGKSWVKVIALAEFFIEGEPVDNETITGRFIHWVKTGPFTTEPPPSGVFIETVRLERPDY